MNVQRYTVQFAYIQFCLDLFIDKNLLSQPPKSLFGREIKNELNVKHTTFANGNEEAMKKAKLDDVNMPNKLSVFYARFDGRSLPLLILNEP